jgi:hypothetical protein
MYQIAIITTWRIEGSDWFNHKTFIKTVESLEIPHLAHAALEASYEAAESHFECDENGKDFLFGEDVERGYTIRDTGLWIDSQTIVCNNPKTNQLQVIYEKDRPDYHQCWRKPEEDA